MTPDKNKKYQFITIQATVTPIAKLQRGQSNGY
jgi:hypothetical protein